MTFLHARCGQVLTIINVLLSQKRHLAAASFVLALVMTFFLTLPATARAETDCDSYGGTCISAERIAEASSTKREKAELKDPLGGATIPELAGRLTSVFTGVAGAFALLMFVYGGFMWLTSGGNTERVAKGKKVFTWAVIGMAVIFGAYAILNQIFLTLRGGT